MSAPDVEPQRSAAFHLRSLLDNVHAGARLAFFMPVRRYDFRAAPLDFALLVALGLVLWIVASALREGLQGTLDLSAVPVFLATELLVLATALAVAMIYRAPGVLMPLAVALVASDPVFELFGLALPYIGAATGLVGSVYFLFIAWVWLVALRAVKVCADSSRPQLYLGALAVSAAMAVAFFLFPRAEVWRPPSEPAEARAPGLTSEGLFHLQGELIERSLAALQPGKRGAAELYFVGFAPDGSQDVFLRELRFVRRLFDERFGTAGRSIALANGQGALEQLPLATATNLSRALTRVGRAMNTEEDVLFLYLSAHGDREHRLSAWQPPLELASLTPTALARMLQESGIKWRVLVVSACYSGGFIEPLRDDNTLIITAAAADRTSFGCESGRDFTYFGQAYFRDALAKTASFTDAFGTAKDLVGKEEAAGKLEPSLPQISIGKAVAAQLDKLGK